MDVGRIFILNCRAALEGTLRSTLSVLTTNQ